jgi:hypothetical protein
MNDAAILADVRRHRERYDVANGQAFRLEWNEELSDLPPVALELLRALRQPRRVFIHWPSCPGRRSPALFKVTRLATAGAAIKVYGRRLYKTREPGREVKLGEITRRTP